MNYGRIADGIALALMTLCSVAVLAGVVYMWVGDVPILAAIGVTVLVAAVGAMLLFMELDRRS